LNEFLPKFTTHSVSHAIRAQGYLVLFLPTANQSHYATKAQDYLPTIFSLWSIFTNSSTYDSQFASLVSRIAEHNLDDGSSEIGLFTKQQIKTVFTTGLRMMNLPVGSRSDGSSSVGGAAGGTATGYGSQGMRVDTKAGSSLLLRKKPEKFKSLARFIVYTIMPDNDGGSSYSLDLLSDMIQATELYYHPSNHGQWSYSLTAFARHLAGEFLKRWREELEEDCTTPQERRLTPELRKEFVLILRPVTYLSMFGKDQYTVGASQSTIKFLSWLEPGLIFPGLLERIYPSLETLTETHRTSSALSILADIALPLFSRDHYPAGGKHLLPLLQLAIPGIDMNDPHKTVSSLMFIATALMCIPICDLTQVPNDYFPTEDYMEGVELSRETEDYLVKATTGEFEEWLAKFMRRVFTIFENLPQENRKKQGSMENGLTQMLLHTCDIVFNQLSEPLYDLALKLVVEFVSDRVLPNAVRAVGQLCDAMTALNPKKAAKVFIPLCISNIQMELEHGAASTVSHAAASTLIPSDATFHWYQNILFSMISSMGPEILVYKEEIISVTQAMINQCRSRRGMMWTGKLVRAVLATVLNIYPLDYRSLNPSQWNDKEFMLKNAHKVWGQPGDPTNLEIQWHTPSEVEKDFALQFLTDFLTPSVQRLNELMNAEQNNTNSHEISNEFCRHLAVIRNCLMGSATMVADDGIDEEENIVLEDNDDTVDDVVTPTLPAGYAFTDLQDSRTLNAREIRKSIGQLIHQLFDYFKTHREDDVESVKVLVKISRVYLAERGVERNQFDNSKNGYSYAKNVGQTPLCKKKYPRNLLIRRAYNHHLLRLRQNVHCCARTPLHDAIMLDLLEMSLGSYAEIRKVSQNALSLTMRSFNGSKALITPYILEALKPDTLADRMKGALYLLTHRSILAAVLRNWKYIPGFVMSICGAQHQDKLSIQELIRRVFLNYISAFNSFTFRVLVPNDLDSILSEISPATVQAPDFVSKVEAIEGKVVSRNQSRSKAYYGLIESLLDLLADSRIHWRFAAMAANFVELFLRSDAKPSQRLAAFANTAALSELPTMRRIGASSTTQLLLYIKQRTLAAGNEDLLITRELRNPLKIDVKVQDPNDPLLGQKLLEASYQKLTPENVGSSILVDNITLGWYVWPEHYTAYKVNIKDFYFDQIDADSLGAYEEFGKTFNTSEYWSKLCGYLSQEVNQKQEDRFSSSSARLFASIFQMYGDAPLASAKEHIEMLALASDQKNSQRAAAEILGGLIRGTKHWNLNKLNTVWEWLTPLLRKVFNVITPDSLTYWESFVRFCSARRDPRRIQPLMDLILESELDPTSDAAFSESRKLLLARALMITLQWRFEPLNQRILPTYFNNIQHPYKQVREVIGVNINELLQLGWIPSHPSVKHLIEYNNLTDGVGNVRTALDPAQSQRVEVVLHSLDRWLDEMVKSNTTVSGSSDYAHASKTGKNYYISI
jgi:proteasome activator subunit 4